MMADSVEANTTRSGFIDPAALMRIQSLQLRAKSVVEGFYNGLHRSPYFGFSVEFSEYRPYVVGDDPRNLDWKLFARSDRYYIKRFEEETNRRCYFVVDQSRSMEYGSIGYSKTEYARTIAATLAYFMSRQRDSVGLVTFDEQVREYLPARHRPGHLHRLMMLLEQPTGGKHTDLPKPLEHLAALVKKRGLVVLISDMLAPIDSLSKGLGYLRSRGHEVLLMRCLDPAELSLSFSEPMMLRDMESGRELFVDPEAIRAGYQRKFTAHQQSLQNICSDLGVSLYSITTDQPLERSLLELIEHQNRVPRTSRRTASRAVNKMGGPP